MKNKVSLTALLVVVLLLSALASVALSIRYVRTLAGAQRLQIATQRLQAQTVIMTRNRAIIQAMAIDALEFSKKNAAMGLLLQPFKPLFEQLHIRTNPNPAQPAPATAPSRPPQRQP